MTTRLTLLSTSRATDAGWLAAADIADIATGLDVPYRLVGGLAVTLLVHALGADGIAQERETADADMGLPFDVCGDDRLLDALLAAGYGQEKGNRFIRRDGDRELVIDVLAPSFRGQMVSNQQRGQLVVDEIPGLKTALFVPATVVEVSAVLTDETTIETSLLLPDVAAALVMKAYAYRGRVAKSDAIDIHRLLEAANVAGRTTKDWPQRVETPEAASILHEMFGSTRANMYLGPAASAKVRLLVQRVVPAP